MDEKPGDRTRRDDMEEILSAIRKSSAPVPPYDGAEARLADMVTEAMDRGRQKMEAAPDPKKINVALVGLAFTIIAGYGTAVTAWSNSRRDIEDLQQRGQKYAPRVEKLEEQLSKFVSVTDLRTSALDSIISTKTNALEAANKVQDERLTNLINRVADGYNRMDEINKKLGQIGEDMASVKAKLSIEPRQPGR